MKHEIAIAVYPPFATNPFDHAAVEQPRDCVTQVLRVANDSPLTLARKLLSSLTRLVTKRSLLCRRLVTTSGHTQSRIMEIACLDLGSNSFHLQHFRVSEAGVPISAFDEKRLVKLGASVARTGAIDSHAWQLGLDAIAQLLSLSQQRHPRHVRAVATSAVRSARNGGDFLAEIERRFPIQVQLLSGIEEAKFSYKGVTASGEHTLDRVAVIDIGGGSTEVTVGHGASCLYVDSLPLGVLALAASYKDHPMSRDGILEITSDIKRTYGRRLSLAGGLGPRAIVFASGTARAVHRVVGHGSDVKQSDRGVIHLTDLYSSLERIVWLGSGEFAALGIEAERQDTIGLAHVAMIAIMECLGCTTAKISNGGMRQGLAVEEHQRHARTIVSAA